MGFLFFIVLILSIYLYLSWNKDKTKFNKIIDELKAKIQDLSKYEGILNVEEKSNEIIKNADEFKKNAEMEANKLISSSIEEAKIKADKILQEANEIRNKNIQEIKKSKAKYEELLSNATIEANKIVEDAKIKAHEIAGEAYEALKNKENLEHTAKAMKNIIDGYGDEYLIPTYSLLDELADKFGYSEAGEELKKARERTKFMVKNKTAATCDYVETVRRETAINFVTDAFNGKVDSILANIKHDNFGTLEQKIKDSYYLVNTLGKSFRNAVITEEYLQSRIEELKLGVIACELRFKEKEEQRLIKEQIREEERAMREYEKARKEAEKEEEMLKKAMEKVRKELEGATEQQKLKYEQQLAELNEKLKAAEEKNQKALSMAQQTKSGHVYIISNIGSFGEDIYKIGMTRRLEPLDRVKELGDASVPFSFDVHAMIYCEDAPSLETNLHKLFVKSQLNKINPRKEFFKLNIKELRKEIEEMGILAKWTMTAEASEYRESLVLEKSLLTNSTQQEQWIKYQLESENLIAATSDDE